ncbi:MAG: hypothetical protein AAFW89_01090 [Bacteroidota bacterium]
MRINKYLLFLTIFMLCAPALSAQDTSDTVRRFGFSASIQSEHMDFLIPIWVDDRVVIAPSVSYRNIEGDTDDLSLVVAQRFFLSTPVNATPFLGFRLGTVIGIPEESEVDNTIDYIGGVGFGGEYFFKPKFSVGIELQGNLTISDKRSSRFDNPGNINFSTATALTASIYF